GKPAFAFAGHFAAQDDDVAVDADGDVLSPLERGGAVDDLLEIRTGDDADPGEGQFFAQPCGVGRHLAHADGGEAEEGGTGGAGDAGGRGGGSGDRIEW